MAIKDYGMFTEAGNALISGVVFTAMSAGLNRDQVCEILYDIAALDGFSEASDTVVRECVYGTLEAA